MSKLFYVATSFLLLAIAVTMFLGMREASPAFGDTPTLDGFEINTGDNQVIVTLYTDERAKVTTETTEANGSRQFAIILPQARLSDRQLNNGMPVVIDNKNKFIGRAVPTADGQVKIVLPNIPVENYAISIRQQQPGKSVPSGTESTVIAQSSANQPVAMAAVSEPQLPAEPTRQSIQDIPRGEARPAIQPRPAITGVDSRFEMLASDFAHGTPVATAQPRMSSGPRIQQISQGGHSARTASRARTVASTPAAPQQQVVENPYVGSLLRKQPRPNYLREQEAAPQPASSGSNDPAMTTLSVAESLHTNPTLETQPIAGNDPLWYLHSLPPFDPNQGLDSTNLAAAAKQDNAALTPSQTQAVQPAGTTVVTYESPLSEAISMVKRLPKWLMVMIALFLGGIGLFTAIGSLLVARQLYHTLHQKPQDVPFLYSGLSPAIGVSAMSLSQQYNLAATLAVSESTAQPPTKTEPEDVTRFSDTTAVNAMDYLKNTATGVQEATRPSTLLKFPTSRKSHMRAAKPSLTHRIGRK